MQRLRVRPWERVSIFGKPPGKSPRCWVVRQRFSKADGVNYSLSVSDTRF